MAYDGQVDWSQFGAIDAERAEFVSDAGLVLYGKHVMGGVISVISKIVPTLEKKADNRLI